MNDPLFLRSSVQSNSSLVSIFSASHMCCGKNAVPFACLVAVPSNSIVSSVIFSLPF